jgi:hypothetical protein
MFLFAISCFACPKQNFWFDLIALVRRRWMLVLLAVGKPLSVEDEAERGKFLHTVPFICKYTFSAN